MIPFLVLAAQAIASSEVMKKPSTVEAMRKAVDVLNEVTTQREKDLEEAAAKAKREEEQQERFMEASSIIGKRIEQVRKLKSMTQEEFATACGISRTAVRNIEQGQDSKISSLYAISEALEIPLSVILKDTQTELEKKFAEATSATESA